MTCDSSVHMQTSAVSHRHEGIMLLPAAWSHCRQGSRCRQGRGQGRGLCPPVNSRPLNQHCEEKADSVAFCNKSTVELCCVQSRAQSVHGSSWSTLCSFLCSSPFSLNPPDHLWKEQRSPEKSSRLPHLLVLINFSLLCTDDVLILRLESDIPHVAHFLTSLQAVFCHPLFDPIVYGLKVKEISKHLEQLFGVTAAAGFHIVNFCYFLCCTSVGPRDEVTLLL